jgi:hypothetical protein
MSIHSLVVVVFVIVVAFDSVELFRSSCLLGRWVFVTTFSKPLFTTSLGMVENDLEWDGEEGEQISGMDGNVEQLLSDRDLEMEYVA